MIITSVKKQIMAQLYYYLNSSDTHRGKMDSLYRHYGVVSKKPARSYYKKPCLFKDCYDRVTQYIRRGGTGAILFPQFLKEKEADMAKLPKIFKKVQKKFGFECGKLYL